MFFNYIGLSFNALYQIEPDTLLNDAAFWQTHVHPEDWPGIEAALHHLQEQATQGASPSYKHSYRWQGADGVYHWILDTGRWVHDADAGAEYVVGAWLDYDPNKTLEHQLSENEARFKLTLQDSATTVFIQDTDLRYTWIYNGLMDDTIGKTDYDLFPQETAERLTRLKRDVIQTGERKETEVNVTLPDGSYYVYDLRMEPLQDMHGGIAGVSSIAVNITDLKMTQRTLAQRTHELEQSNRDLEQFAYVASHDLQEPLRAITGYLNLLQTLYSKSLDDEAQDFITEAVDGAERMRKIIRGLLDYSRVHRKAEPFAPVATAPALQDAIDNLQVLITENNAIITHDDLPHIKADPVQITQLFQNLIGNAIKFRHPERTPKIHIGVCGEADEWCFSVQDNGIGMEMRFAERIFTIFQRLHTREAYEGTGIGLALCRRIVERHQGRIWLESEPEHGSTFFFTIAQTL